MSKQDSHFFNNFSLVLGILFAVTIGLFVLARHVGAEHQVKQVTRDPRFLASVEERLQPAARVAIAGQDNSALKIESVGPAAPARELPEDGTAAYAQACATCHGSGLAGAPKAGDKGAWGPRIAQGKDTLYKHALEGFTGKAGVMPAKGGQTAWPDELVREAVDHMVEMAQ